MTTAATQAMAQETETVAGETAAGPSRPVIAVVLAGGGAKGAAHIGVLEVLEELRVPVDIITGTSMGSFVGGLYASGQSIEQIKGYLTEVDWNAGYRDQVDRADRRLRDKAYEDRYQFNTDLGIGFGTLKTPKGVVQGQNMLQILRETSRNPPAMDSFDNMAIRYRSVATDIVKLEQVVMDKGYLVDAMMASMSVPGALPPYEHEGRLLVDGGVVNNMPVDLAREMGADIIIAVDISSNYKDKDELNSFLDVGGQLSNYLVQRSTVAQAELLTEKDTLLNPAVGDIETTDFASMSKAYQLGYDEAQRYRMQLARYSLSKSDYQAHLEDKRIKADLMIFADEIPIDVFEVRNQSHFSMDTLDKRLDLDAQTAPTLDEIEQGITRLYALDRFERITYKVEQRESENAIVVTVDEKDWGPNYLNFRFFLEDDFTTDSQYSLGASANFTNLGEIGGEIRTSVEFGTDKWLSVDLYSPFFANQVLFNALNVTYSDEKRNVALLSADGLEIDDLDRTSDYLPISYEQFEVDGAIGLKPALWNELRVGLRYTDGKAELSSLPSLGNSKFDRKAAYISYLHDTLDSIAFPTQGSYLSLEYKWSRDSVDELGETYKDNVDEFRAEWIEAFTFLEKHSLSSRLDVGILESDDDILIPIDPYDLGGFHNLSGIPRNSLIGQNKAFGKLVYRYRWFENDFGMFQSPIYIGASMEYGGVWFGSGRSFDDLPLFAAGSLFAGIDSPIGAVRLGYGLAEGGNDSVYLIIGNSFN